MIQDSKLKKEVIAKRVAMELHDGDIVNLGIGIPTLVANYLPSGVEIFLQSENGILGMGPAPRPGFEHPQLINAGGMPVTFLPGAAAFDSAMSFGLIRGGHVDATVLGALQVDEEGHLANWMIPGKPSKIVKKCSLPLTSIRRVNLIVTDMAVIEHLYPKSEFDCHGHGGH